jgi:predicted Zn-dependent peptidase
MQLNSIDGVFNVSGVLKSLLTAQLDEQFFYQFIDTIKNIEPNQIQTMAQKYLDLDKLTEVIVL